MLGRSSISNEWDWQNIVGGIYFILISNKKLNQTSPDVPFIYIYSEVPELFNFLERHR
jgi:hypothetical protein